ncbi:MAG: serine dehydratase [Bacteroidia bacterium]|nr:MAG: serine dehydratase [Bacteroidia bacterium]
MRGPSSSHSAAALRIGRMCRDLMSGNPGKVVVSYDLHDALATTHESQGSDMGMKGGILGFEADDPRLLQLDQHLADAGIEIRFEVGDSGKRLPNLYQVELRNQHEMIRVEAVSTGGGMIRMMELNGTAVSMEGDCHETLIWSKDLKALQEISETAGWAEKALLHQGAEPLLELRSNFAPDEAWVTKIKKLPVVLRLSLVKPVLPVLATGKDQVPFSSCKEMLQFHTSYPQDPWEMALAYESARGGISRKEARVMMDHIYEVMRKAVETGLKGTDYQDRILGSQSPAYKRELDKGKLSKDDALHRLTLYVSAIMEVKSSMGVIVAAPTAGSCGTFPGAVLGVADSLELSKEDVVNALLTGSLVGIFIAGSSTFSAEIGGCQAECGSGAGMAAAAIITLMGGTLEQSMAAASMALQNSLGMICDPIAARVEAPCLGKNVSSAANALTCANMVMAGYDPLIPLDEVVETMDRVGRSLPFELRCTALGGLAITPTAREIEKRLNK